MSTIRLEEKVLTRNDVRARENRELFRARGIAVLNLVSAPGSGKTSLLERTLGTLAGEMRVAVIEGDVQTDNDARRIARTGVPVHAIQTGGACHLEAGMVAQALSSFDLSALDLLIIENVGNLVCPSAFDLGEGARVALISVTEGDDKPLKYPAMFHTADVMVVNKIDLLPFTDFSVETAVAHARSLNPGLTVLTASCRTGEGLEGWIAWVRAFVRDVVKRARG